MSDVSCSYTSAPLSECESSLVWEVEGFLWEMIAEMPPEPMPERHRGRPRVLPALALWSGLLVCVIRGFSSQLSLWRLLSRRGFWWFPRFPVQDQAVYKRLGQGGTAPLERLFEQASRLLALRLRGMEGFDLAPFAAQVVAVDETTLDAVARTLPSLRGVTKGDERLLPGKMAAVFDLRRQQWVRAEMTAEPHQNEKVLARSLVEGLPPGSLILADLGYFGFAWLDWLTDQGYWWASRLRARTSYRIIHTFYQDRDAFDGLVWLGAHRADRAAHAVRLVSLRAGGRQRRYVTNVRDPHALSIGDLARLYARRWDIEMAFRLVKQRLGLRMLWSARPVVVQQQVWAVLIISQILQALRLEIAWRAGVDPFEVSMALFVEYAPRLAAEGDDPVRVFVEQGRELGFIRPSRRTEIRAPDVPVQAITPAPQGLELTRAPRYAGRKCN